MRLAFTKMQGAGNDFIVVEAGAAEADCNRLAVAMCDRHYGVGADGLLLLGPSEIADFSMRVFNADGSEASACGNGARCIVKYYTEKNQVESTDGRLTVETVAGVRDAWFIRSGDKAGQVRIGMGRPRYGADPVHGGHGKDGLDITRRRVNVSGTELWLDLISLGNSHAVCFMEAPLRDFPLSQIGEELDRQVFPGGVNLEIARVLSRRHIEARVWEHGVGETLACGSGASAIMVAAHLRGAIENAIEVSLTGGTLAVEWDGSSEVFLTGPAETVFRGEWVGADIRKLPTSQKPIKNEVLA